MFFLFRIIRNIYDTKMAAVEEEDVLKFERLDALLVPPAKLRR